ncbi:hypothetical protein AB0B15_39870 [Streptomyces sp. NPDC045456]|uniref:hypothetical protein n=1 Tax=Streptomyces sp. NPDC045456 TaxID=3155254 RepID=UPI0033D14985
MQVHEPALTGPGWIYLLCRECAARPPWELTDEEWAQLVVKDQQGRGDTCAPSVSNSAPDPLGSGADAGPGGCYG